MAVAGLFLTGVIGGAILFAILGALRRGYGIAFGLALGIILGIPIMLISVHASQTASVGPEARAIWCCWRLSSGAQFWAAWNSG
jgi:hypothetical protein